MCANDGQLPPDPPWRVWLLMAGRGFGKTRAGAEAVSGLARLNPEARIALVAATIGEAERVMIHGPSGLFAVSERGEDLVYYPSRGLIEFASGATGHLYSGANPDGLRGPQHHFAWCDELAKWAYPQAAWDNLMLGPEARRGRGRDRHDDAAADRAAACAGGRGPARSGAVAGPKTIRRIWPVSSSPTSAPATAARGSGGRSWTGS